MRELKFRQFIDGEYWYWGYGVNPDPNEFVPPKDPSVPSEQYTGLNDGHGIKVYEKDIVELINAPRWGGHDHMCGRGEVVFNKEDLQFTARKAKGNNLLLNWGGTESIKVIGNANENPELLK